LTNQCIDIAEEKTASGSKVVQWDKTGGANQQWRVIPAGPNVYRIQSVSAAGQYLAIKNDSVDDGGKLEINTSEASSSSWRIEGYCPV
jgi:hypothetical protein